MRHPTIAVEKIADLDVSAASGLVERDRCLHVIADDELSLRMYDLDGTPRGRVALFAGALADGHAERKAAKPDLEALALLPDGSLLALGSGSTAKRRRAAWITGGPNLDVRGVDMAPLYARLEPELPELNIEGAVVHGGALRLFQRGNGAARVNAIVDLDLDGVVATLAGGGALSGSLVVRVARVDLGDLHGVPLSFTDAAVRGDALLFAAAAEDTASAYDDGACAGSVIGVLEQDRARVLGVVAGYKIEGITSVGDALYLVADADDRLVPAPLLRAQRADAP